MTHRPRAVVRVSGTLVTLCLLAGIVAAQVPAPRKTKDVMPVYPRESLQAGDEGVVYLELKVTASGAVGQALILRSECKRLEQAALTAARQWQYAPMSVNGTPVPFTVVDIIPFRLPERFKERAGRTGACKWTEPRKPVTE